MKITVSNTNLTHAGNGAQATMPIINPDKALCYRLAGLVATMVLNEQALLKGGE